MFKNSILVTAHQDDEILWFSSILNKVDEIVFCFLDVKSKPRLTLARSQSLSEYPMKNISCLNLEDADVFNGANWDNPMTTQYGIEISRGGFSDKTYKENYHSLIRVLEQKLSGYQNVFTHSPWGEYGNEKHVQIYSVVKRLQEKMNFNLWFPNYCSNKSFNLFTKCMSDIDSKFKTMKTNRPLAQEIESLYKKNGCWTWYDDWKWLNEESFIMYKRPDERNKINGRILPINMINVEYPGKSKRKSRISRLLEFPYRRKAFAQ